MCFFCSLPSGYTFGIPHLTDCLLINYQKTISTVTIPVPQLNDVQLAGLDSWLRDLLWESQFPLSTSTAIAIPLSPPPEIYRLKGRILLSTGKVKMVQGVRDVFEITDLDIKADDVRDTTGKLVLIGRGLANLAWEDTLLTRIGRR